MNKIHGHHNFPVLQMPWLRGWISDRTAQYQIEQLKEMPCLKTASCFCSHGGHREPHFYFLKVFPILSVWIFMIKLLHKHRDLISLIKTNGQAKYVWLLCGWRETLRLAFSLHFYRLVPPDLVIYLGFQACSLPYGLSVFFFKHSFLWTLFIFLFFGPLCCTLLPWWRQLSASAVLLTL